MKQSDNASSSKEQQLLSLAKAGNQSATEALLLQYKGLVRKIARNFYMVSGGDSDDILQEGTIGLLKAISTYKEESVTAFSTYAYNCIANNIKDALRKTQTLNNQMLNEALQGSEQADEAQSTTDVILHYSEQEYKEKFYSILSTLITAEQMVVFKLYMDGFSYKEIAEKTNKTAKNIDNTLTAIKIKIKKAEQKFATIQGE